MTYAALIDDEGINSQYLVVMNPRRVITSAWTLVSGTIFSTTFDFGQVTILLDDGVTLTEAASASVSSNEWFWEPTTSLLTADVGADPTSSVMIASYELYFGTFDAHIGRDPTDTSSRQVYYEPLIEKSPLITSSTKDILFGFLPTFTGSLTLSNATHLIQEDIFNASFSKSDVTVYHWIGDLEEANIKLVLKAQTRLIDYTDKSVVFQIANRTDVFDQEFRNQVGTSFYTAAAFAGLDPKFDNRPIRQVFGKVEGFVAVNIDFNNNNPLGTDNRKYSVIADETNLATLNLTVSSSGTPTTTTTPFDDADGINVRDEIANTTLGRYATVTGVNKAGSPHIVSHIAWEGGGSAAAGNTVVRLFVGEIIIQSQGTQVRPRADRDYTVFTDATNKVAGITLTDNIEVTNLGLPNPITPSDKILMRVYGHTNQTTKNAIAFGTDSADTNNLTDPIVILWQLLKDLGLDESELDGTTFGTLQATNTEQISLAIPDKSTGNFPTFKKLIIDISQTLLLKLFLNDDILWKPSLIGPLEASDKTIEDDEILQASVRYRFDYKDIISKAIVSYSFRELGPGFSANVTQNAQSTSATAQDLHQIEKQKTFRSLHFLAVDAQNLADHLAFALGDRRGILKIRTKNRFFDTILDEVIKVTRDRLPGFEFVLDTLRSRDFAATKTSKSLREITIDIDDQKSIEDNSGSW